MLPSSFANRLVSLVFYDTLDHQKELAFAFGGQRSSVLRKRLACSHNELREHRRDADCGFQRSRLAFADNLGADRRHELIMRQFFAGLFQA